MNGFRGWSQGDRKPSSGLQECRRRRRDRNFLYYFSTYPRLLNLSWCGNFTLIRLYKRNLKNNYVMNLERK